MPIRRVKGKLLKHQVMSKYRMLRAHLPQTYKYRPSILFSMLKKHSSVFVKPDRRSQGTGIIRVKKLRNHHYKVSWRLQHRRVHKSKILPIIKNRLHRKKTYLVQRGLKLAKYKGRFVDIRVYMQKPTSSWKISGKVVRIAAPLKFVTNYHQGGKPETLKKVL